MISYSAKLICLILLKILTTVSLECDNISNVSMTVKYWKEGSSDVTVSGCIERRIFDGKVPEEIHVYHQNIKKLEKDSVKHLIRLDTLEFKNCGIESIVRNALRNLPVIRVVEITFNPKLRTIVGGVFDIFDTIQILRLHHNGIDTITDEALSNMTLREVDFSFNKFRKFDPMWFAYSPYIKHLYFQNNRITKLPRRAFDTMEELEDIRFDNNQISQIGDEAFRKLNKLKTLGLGNNKLIAISNNIFPRNIYIESLDIRGNYLHAITNIVMSQLTVKEIVLNYNPWLCSCETHLIKWLNLNHTIIKKPDNCNLNYLPVCIGTVEGKCQKLEDFSELFNKFMEIIRSMPATDKKCAGLEDY